MESDIDRKSPSELAFSESLVESVREGSGGAYSRAEAINRIKERTGNLGHRLLQYVADLEFLYKSDKINFDNVDEIDTDDGETPFGLWPNLWSIFPFIHHGDTVGDWYIWDNPSDLGISPDCNSDAVNFGLTLAQIPRIFSEADSSNNPSLPLEDVAWGFLIGLVSDDVDHKQPDGQYEEITEILEKCSELADGRKQYAKSAVDHMESKPASTAIKELGYKPTSAIKSHLIRKTNFEEPNTVEEYKEIFEPAFEEMEKSVRFQFYLDLIRDIEEDYEELTNRGWNNFKYISLIRILGQEDSPVDQQDIAEQLGSNTEEAVKMLRDLAGEAKDTIGKNYDDKPFVKRENGESLELNESGEVIKTYEGTKWELTKYGTLFYQVTEVDDKGYDMLYSLGIQPKYNSNEDHFLIRDIFREHYGRQDIDDDPEYPDDTVYRYDTL